ncbi:MAG: helix-turn-helix transcriptional regulator [Acutalibacteraceae bacterium]|nr:helix-turn-helix transcriptional regulator [Acutalibacteraceae bacterium]
MFINKTAEGLNNVCSKNIAKLRTAMKISQREIADRMQLVGIDIDKNAIQRIECGKRFVTDIEIIAFAKVFKVGYDELLNLLP